MYILLIGKVKVNFIFPSSKDGHYSIFILSWAFLLPSIWSYNIYLKYFHTKLNTSCYWYNIFHQFPLNILYTQAKFYFTMLLILEQFIAP